MDAKETKARKFLDEYNRIVDRFVNDMMYMEEKNIALLYLRVAVFEDISFLQAVRKYECCRAEAEPVQEDGGKITIKTAYHLNPRRHRLKIPPLLKSRLSGSAIRILSELIDK